MVPALQSMQNTCDYYMIVAFLNICFCYDHVAIQPRGRKKTKLVSSDQFRQNALVRENLITGEKTLFDSLDKRVTGREKEKKRRKRRTENCS